MTDLLDPEEVAGLQRDFRQVLLKLAAPDPTAVIAGPMSRMGKQVFGHKPLLAGAVAGARKAQTNEQDAGGGAALGAVGAGLGGTVGYKGGLGAGRAVARKLTQLGAEPGKALTALPAGMLLGGLGGAVGGYKLLTSRYSNDKTAALAEELEALGGCTRGQAAALRKHAVSEDQARRSLDRLDSLESNKPSRGQAVRYGGIGAVGGGVAGMLGNAIEHGGPLKGGTPRARVLNVAANAAKGALAGGAIPLARNQLDRRAEIGTLRNFMSEQERR